MEGGRRKRGNRSSHTLDIPQNVSRRYVHDAISIFAQKGVATIVTCRAITPAMRFPIHLDDQPAFSTIEIHDIGTDWMLVAKLDAGLPTAKPLPKQHYRQAHLLPELARDDRFRA